MMTSEMFKKLGPKVSLLVILVFYSSVFFGQCPTATPNVNDTCIIAGQPAKLNASGSSNAFSWYDASTGGNHFGNGSGFDPGNVASTTTFYAAAAEQNYALDFDGTNDRIAIQNYTYNSTGMIQLTVEAWVKTTSNSPMIIASFDRNEYWRLGVGSTGASAGRVSWSVQTSGGTLDMGGSAIVNDGQWHHVAATYLLGVATIYVDGVVDASSIAFIGSTWGTGKTRFGFVGVGSEASSFGFPSGPNQHFDGEIDEVRVWSDARTPAEILNNKDNCLLGTEPNLEIYYKINNGSGSSIVTDQVSNSDGTLTFMDPTTDWQTRVADYSCPSCESARVPLTVTISNTPPVSISATNQTSCIGNTVLFDAGSGYTSYLWSTGANTQTVNISSGGTYSIIAEQAGCYSQDSLEIIGDIQDAQTNGLFDGANDYVAIDGFFYNSAAITELSVEAWVRTTDGGNQIIASFDRSDYWRLGINGEGAGTGQVAWNLRTSAGILDFGSTARVDDGNWHHIVGTYNNGLASIYIDGELDSDATRGTTVGTGTTRYGYIGTGSEATSFNGSRGPNRYFDGEIEELRIWNKALTISEIREQMCINLKGVPSPNLVSYFKFNEGSGIELMSEVGSVSGQAFNINTSSFWENSGAPVGDNSVNLYANALTGSSISITACSGDSITVSDITGSATGIQLYSLEMDPTNSNGIDSFLIGNHYYGIFFIGDQTAAYKAEISYNNNALVNSDNQFGLTMLSRVDKTESGFIAETTNNDEVAKVLTANLTGRNELILDSKYYIWTGNSNINWQVASNWNPTSVPSANSSILIPDVTNQPRLDQDRIVGSLIMDTGSSADLNGNTLGINGNLIANGQIISNSGQISFQGIGPQTFVAGVPQVIDNISTSNLSSVTMEQNHIQLKNTLTVQNGVFDTNDSLILVSDANRTARISEITGGGSIIGEIEMQRYIDAGETYWRFFSSAVQDATVEDYQGDFITSGYIGSDFPSFPFTSVYTYDEGTGYVAVADASQVIDQGQGLMVWSGDNSDTTLPFVVDYRGVPNQGDISMPVTFSATDGWNLVGNPYASTIDWDLINASDRQNIANSIYILNPDTEQYATYINGASANGGSNLIPSQQAFWVGATASNPVLTFRESIKSSIDQPFLKSGSNISSGVHILLSGNNKTDEAVLRHVENATDGYDSEFDATKKFASWMKYPHVSILNADLVDYTVHSFDKAYQEWSLPLRTIVFENGDYDLIFTDLIELDVPCIKLEDTYSGQIYTVEENVPITFTMSDTTYLPRFILHLGKNYDVEPKAALCNGELGSVSIGLDNFESGTFDLIASDGSSVPGNFNGNLKIDSLKAGNYSIIMTGLNNLCQSNQFDFEVLEPSELLIIPTINPETFGQDGSIHLQVIGGTPDYTYLWSDGSDSSVITHLNSGNYQVVVTDQNNCNITEQFSLSSILGVNETNIDEVTKFTYYSSENKVSLNGILDKNYTLFDISGKVITEFEIGNGIKKIDLDLPNSLSKGTYILTGISNSYTFIK